MSLLTLLPARKIIIFPNSGGTKVIKPKTKKFGSYHVKAITIKTSRMAKTSVSQNAMTSNLLLEASIAVPDLRNRPRPDATVATTTAQTISDTKSCGIKNMDAKPDAISGDSITTINPIVINVRTEDDK